MANVQVIAIAPTYHPSAGNQEKGKTFLLPEEDVVRYVEAKLVAVIGAVEQAVGAVLSIGEDSSLDQLKAAFNVDMPAGEYLDKFPDGPLSNIALRILELEFEANNNAQ